MRYNVPTILSVVSLGLSSIGLGMSVYNICDSDRTPTVEPVYSETSTTEPETTTTTDTETTTTTETTTSTTVETTVTTETSTTEVMTEPVVIETQPVVTAAPTEIDIPVETTTVETVTETVANTPNEEFIGTFTRGTYYTFGSRGGSGRTLVSGYSIASRALYEMYGYGDYKVRIECDEFPALNGIYSLDDCSAKGDNRVIDFWFAPGDVPAYFRQMGVLEVRAYIIYN